MTVRDLLTRRGSTAELITTVGVVLAVQAGAQAVWDHLGISLVAGLLAAVVVTTAWATLSRRGGARRGRGRGAPALSRVGRRRGSS